MSAPPDQLRPHFAGLWLQQEGPQGQVYAGTDINGTEVTIAVLAEALASQSGVRNAFADVVWRHSVGSEPGRVTVYAADLHGARPWAAIRGRFGQPGAEQLLIALAGAAPTVATPAGWIPPPPPPLPRSYPPQPPVRSRSRWPWALGVVGGVIAVGLVAVVAIVGPRVLRDDTPGPAALPTGTPAVADSPAASPADSPAASPAPEQADEPTGEPDLREVQPVSLVGPTFAPDEDTYTMAFNGWPFAFRAPKDWTCANGQELPRIDGEVKACFSLEVEGGVVLWECRADCDEAEQQEKLDIWFADEPGQPVQWDNRLTYYVETEENDDGRYAINLAGFFGAGSGEPRWMVGVSFESLPEAREGTQKVVNDILSQTS